MPRLEGLLPYAGQVLIEGTNLSEGRGTTTPFEVVGAPFIDGQRLADTLNHVGLDGVVTRPIRFRPTFQKWADRSCGGVFLHVTDANLYRPVRVTAALLACVRRLWPGDFAWLQPPYEYEPEKMPIDILAGTSALREAIDAGAAPDEAAATLQLDDDSWWREVQPFLLYSR